MLETINICILGDGSVGKSSVTLRFTNDKFYENTIPTILNRITFNKLIDNKEVKFHVNDTSGQEEYELVRDIYIGRCDAFVLIYSITCMNSLSQLKIIMDSIIRIKNDDDISIILVGNKCDLEDERVVNRKTAKKLAYNWNCKFYETSVKNNTNINEVFTELIKDFLLKKISKDKKKDKKNKKKM